MTLKLKMMRFVYSFNVVVFYFIENYICIHNMIQFCILFLSLHLILNEFLLIINGIQESYYRCVKENQLTGMTVDNDDLEIEYDEDGNPIAPQKSKLIKPLPSIDHSLIEYKPFEKNFYNGKLISSTSLLWHHFIQWSL